MREIERPDRSGLMNDRAALMPTSRAETVGSKLGIPRPGSFIYADMSELEIYCNHVARP